MMAEDECRRRWALEQAVELALGLVRAGRESTAAEIVADAKAIEAYVKGDGAQGAVVVTYTPLGEPGHSPTGTDPRHA